MIGQYGKFRGVEFRLEDLPLVRALARGQTFDLRNGGYATDRECLERLAGTGFATKVEAIQPVANFREGRTRYRASDQLLALPETPIVSFDTMAQNLGCSFDKAAQRKWRVKMKNKSKAPREFPPLFEVRCQARAAEKRSEEFQDVFTEQYPVEEGDEYQFSSPGLTKWYVQRFCSDNNLMKE